MDWNNIDICLATYKRPVLLRDCLDSIAAQILKEEVKLHIIVIDNDCLRSAHPVVDDFAATHEGVVIYDCEPIANIAKARNRGRQLATHDVIFFIDDDETADPHWVNSHLENLKRSGSSVSLGNVIPIYPESTPSWIIESGVYERKTHLPGAKLKTAATNNTAVVSSVLSESPFDEDYGITGGSDTKLFTGMFKNGVSIIWCDKAIVFEKVPEDRLKIAWVLKRGYRVGQTHARVRCEDKTLVGRAGFAGYQSILVLVSGLRLLRAAFLGRGQMLFCAREVAKRLGRITATMGQYYKEYKGK